MGIESAPNFESDRIEKKEILREAEGGPTEPSCLHRALFKMAADCGNDEDLDQVGQAVVDRVAPGRYVLECQMSECERVYDVSTIGTVQVNDFRNVCHEATVSIGKTLLLDSDGIR